MSYDACAATSSRFHGYELKSSATLPEPCESAKSVHKHPSETELRPPSQMATGVSLMYVRTCAPALPCAVRAVPVNGHLREPEATKSDWSLRAQRTNSQSVKRNDDLNPCPLIIPGERRARAARGCRALWAEWLWWRAANAASRSANTGRKPLHPNPIHAHTPTVQWQGT